MQKSCSSLLFVLIICLLCNHGYAQQAGRLKAGMRIESSLVIERDHYLLPAPASKDLSVITIAGRNITVNFNQAVLQGSDNNTAPNEMKGLAIRIEAGSENITLKNLDVHGYKIAILADSVSHLNIIHCNLGYNWRQKLHSNLDREDVSDWMSYHKNEKGEWMRYGAAIYLNNCTDALIKDNFVTGGQCALLMTRCNKAQILDNDFSFNSGLGIGLYRSSDNLIYHNKLDFNVRGFSNGKYRRGQDSAGILVFEQSSENVFAYNSATHSGDGFFLWAGQTTMDTGKGGCNNNLVYGNDFSYAPTNGAELTFSSNSVLNNRIWGCNHGIWGGYSYDSDFSDNRFVHNKIAIAIEHGQNINIAMNEFNSDETAIKLWSREKQPDSWTYAQLRNTQSKNYWIASNRFLNTKTVYDIMGTDTVVFSGNRKSNTMEDWKLGDRVSELDTTRENEFLDLDYQKDKRLAPIKYDQLPEQLFPQGCQEIRITPWGPYDFRYPILWLTDIDSNHLYHFEILGPKGNWEKKRVKGFDIIKEGVDSFPSTLIAKPDTNSVQKLIQLTYKGQEFIDQFGNTKNANSDQTFEFRAFQPKSQWLVKWYQWDSLSNPNNNYPAFMQLLETHPLQTILTEKIDFVWWGKPGNNLPADSFATVATSTIDLPKGLYEIGITADDLAKLFIDGKEVINAWDAKFVEFDEYTHHTVKLKLEGKHDFKIIQADNQGLATLQFYLQPVNSPPVDEK